MTRAEFAREMARLAAAYRTDVSEATATLYFEILGGLDARDLADAVRDHVTCCKWFPQVAELFDAADTFKQERLRVEREARRPVAAIPAEVGDLAENRRRVRELIETVKRRLGWLGA